MINKKRHETQDTGHGYPSNSHRFPMMQFQGTSKFGLNVLCTQAAMICGGQKNSRGASNIHHGRIIMNEIMIRVIENYQTISR